MGRAERATLRAWAELPADRLDEQLDGAERRGELDRALADAGSVTGGAETHSSVLRWPYLLAAAAVIPIGVLLYLNAGPATPLAAALDSVQVAQRDGRPVPLAAAQQVRDLVGDDAAVLLLADPFDPDVLEDAARGTGALRGPESTGLHLVRPRATIASTRPEFRLRTGLPNDSAWRVELELKQVDGTKTHTLTIEQAAGHEGDLRAELAPSVALAPGRWRVTARLAATHELPLAPARGEFRVELPAAIEELRDGVPAAGDAALDARVLGAALLSRGFAAEALRALEAAGEGIDAVVLRVRAHALLGDREQVDVLRDQWRELRRKR